MNRQRKQGGKRVRARLPEREWNFDAVPNRELVTCCYWEYARESAFIKGLRERSRQARESNLTFKQRREMVGADFGRIFAALGRTAVLFQEGIYGLDGAAAHKDAVSPFPQPWQSLSAEMRAILLATTEWTPGMVQDFPAFRWSRFLRAMALAEHLKRSHPHPKDSRFPSEPIPESLDDFFWSGNFPRTNRPSFMSAGGTEVLLVEIEWGRFTNKQIVDCFRKWVRAHRPKEVKELSGRGHDPQDWRARLERLGLLRLRHRYTFRDAKLFLQMLPRTAKTTNAGECNREAKKAVNDFHSLFPFLNPAEMPQSWKMK